MQTLSGLTVFITGASAGIGLATAEAFAATGANLILTARRIDRLTALAEKLEAQHQIRVLPLSLNVQDQSAVETLIAELPPEWQAIDILVNSAGLALSLDKIQDADPKNWDQMIDTNIKGLLYVTRAVLPGMIARDRGHIINLSSIAGHTYYPGGNVYSATKHAVKALCKSLRLDLMGTAIRVTEIAPGAVETEFSLVRFEGDDVRAKQVYQGYEPLVAEDIAETILFCATRPKHVNVSLLEVYPTAQAYGVNFHREILG